jgi:hypothetical protein
MELQDDVLQSQHHLLRDEDTVVELVKLKAELPQKGLRLRGTEPWWLVCNAGGNGIINGGREGASTSATTSVAGRADVVGENWPSFDLLAVT